MSCISTTNTNNSTNTTASASAIRQLNTSNSKANQDSLLLSKKINFILSNRCNANNNNSSSSTNIINNNNLTNQQVSVDEEDLIIAEENVDDTDVQYEQEEDEEEEENEQLEHNHNHPNQQAIMNESKVIESHSTQLNKATIESLLSNKFNTNKRKKKPIISHNNNNNNNSTNQHSDEESDDNIETESTRNDLDYDLKHTTNDYNDINTSNNGGVTIQDDDDDDVVEEQEQEDEMNTSSNNLTTNANEMIDENNNHINSTNNNNNTSSSSNNNNISDIEERYSKEHRTLLNSNDFTQTNDLANDLIVCGKCQADFKLADIIAFIEHKMSKCSKNKQTVNSKSRLTNSGFKYKHQQQSDETWNSKFLLTFFFFISET